MIKDQNLVSKGQKKQTVKGEKIEEEEEEEKKKRREEESQAKKVWKLNLSMELYGSMEF